MSKINNLFLQNSYQDLKDNYEKVLKGIEKSWDVIVITASNSMQAKTYELQLDKRRKEGLLPSNIDFLVIPDLNDERIGSGGATLNVFVELNKKYDLSKKKILLIHSGGDSKRVPQYSCYGKLFSPVPCEFSKFKASTLFDETIMIMSDFPKRMDYGVFIMCGDSLALFNPLQVDLQYKKAAVVSMKMPKEMGTKHGVFVSDENNNVTEFLHKQPLEVLEQKAVENITEALNVIFQEAESNRDRIGYDRINK
jgi:fucokinase